MSAKPLPETDDTIYMVSQWKDDLDSQAPWWQRVFHDYIYAPFNEFSLKVMKVPPWTDATVEGDKVHLSRFEVEGFFGSEHEADLGCLDTRWSYKDYRYGRLMPSRSGQYGNGPVFPRANNPRKRIRPILEMVISPRKEVQQSLGILKHETDKLSEVLNPK